MKKYWIKELKDNQCIHAHTKKIAKKLCKKFHSLGLTWRNGDSYLDKDNWNVFKEETVYYPSKGKCSNTWCSSIARPEVITIDQLLDFQENEYPKVMEVSSNGTNWHKRVVFMEKNNKFLAWNGAESIEEAEYEVNTVPWLYAREIQPTLELTIDQIAHKFNVSPEQIKIKKLNN